MGSSVRGLLARFDIPLRRVLFSINFVLHFKWKVDIICFRKGLRTILFFLFFSRQIWCDFFYWNLKPSQESFDATPLSTLLHSIYTWLPTFFFNKVLMLARWEIVIRIFFFSSNENIKHLIIRDVKSWKACAECNHIPWTYLLIMRYIYIYICRSAWLESPSFALTKLLS